MKKLIKTNEGFSISRKTLLAITLFATVYWCELLRLALLIPGDETMYARVVSIQIQSGKTNEAASIYQDSVVPAAKKQKGFKSALLLTDSDTGKAVSVTLWETEADMIAGETSAYFQEQITKLRVVTATPAIREHYEVSVQT